MVQCLGAEPVGSGSYPVDIINKDLKYGADAITEDGKTVQIKTNHAASSIGFRGDANLMLVIHVADNGEFKELHFGDFQKVKDSSNYSARDNKQSITISKLKKLRDE